MPALAVCERHPYTAMRLGVIGLGQAGGKILDALLDYDSRTGGNIVVGAAAVNTAEQDLHGLQNVPQEHRTLIGQARVKGNGVGADNELGAEVAEEDIDEVMAAVDHIPTHEVDAFLVIAALGGGTGSGSAPVVAKHLKSIYTEPVYGLGILPAEDEGGIYTLNAARSLQTFTREADNLLLFDNDAWRDSGESLAGGYDAINERIARRLGVLFSAGEIQADGTVAESVVDSSEIINTLAGGGVSTLGYAVEDIQELQDRGGLLDRFRPDPEPDSTATVNRITSLTRKATLGRLTLPCKVDSTERGLLIVAGPPNYLNRKGIERGRSWLEEEAACMEVRGGDYPLPNGDKVACAVLLSGVTNVPRVKQLQKVAVEASDRIEELREDHDAKLNDLVDGGDEDDLDPLF